MTGTYTVLIDPEGTNTGSLTLALHDVPPDLVGAITIGGPSETVSIAAPGQNARLSFDGTAGQRVNLGVSGVSFSPSGGIAEVSILQPDGTELDSTAVGTAGGEIDTDPLPETGTYTVVVDPRQKTTASLTLTLSEV